VTATAMTEGLIDKGWPALNVTPLHREHIFSFPSHAEKSYTRVQRVKLVSARRNDRLPLVCRRSYPFSFTTIPTSSSSPANSFQSQSWARWTMTPIRSNSELAAGCRRAQT